MSISRREGRSANGKCPEFPLLPWWCPLLLLLGSQLLADGGFFEYEAELARWRQVAEKQQTCFINCDAGYENMLLAVKLDSFHSTKAVWVFPVPASPDKVAIDVLPDLPEFGGSSVVGLARQSLARSFEVMATTQIYPLVFLRGFPSATLDDGYYRGSRKNEPGIAGAGGLEVYEHLEKLGLTAEVVAARERDAPYEYLEGKGLHLPDAAREIVGGYAGRDYALVVAWISDTTRFRPDSSNWRSRESIVKQVVLMVTFPADSMYFPLKLTSIYGSQRVPITLNVLGYVSPVTPDSLGPFIRSECRMEDEYAVNEETRSFFNGRDYFARLRYTSIEIDAPAKYLTQDLLIRDVPPRGVLFADWLHRYSLPVGLVAFLLAALFAGALAAALVFPRDGPTQSRFRWLGLWNFFSVVGVIVATILTREVALAPIPGTVDPASGYRRLLFVILFSLLFLGISFLLATLLRGLV